MSETQNTEYKQSWHDDYLKWICGFANALGGVLKIGVKDDGSITGLTDYKHLLEEIPNKSRDLMGVTIVVNRKTDNNKTYLEIHVPAYSVPISLRGRYYFRSGTTNLELTGNSLTEFLLRKFGKTWDDAIADNFSIDDISTDTINHFKKLAADRLPGILSETDPKLILGKLNLMSKGKFKRAAVLLFAKNPQQFFLQAHVRIGKFISESDIVSSDIVEGNLFEQVEKSLDILTTKYLVSSISYEGIHRREKLEYPYGALREALLNAIVHRSYLTTSAIQIRVYNNKLEILNEGELPEEISVQDLKREHLSKPRNPLIADIFYKSGFIESWGRGTLKIVQDCISGGLPEPDFDINGHLFRITFPKHITAENIDSETILAHDTKNDTENDTKNDTEKRLKTLLMIIGKDPTVSMKELADRLSVSRITVVRDIEKLKKQGIITRIGPAKGGYWSVSK